MKRWLLGAAAAVVLLAVGAGAAYYVHVKSQSRDVKGSSTVEFVTTEAPPPAPKEVEGWVRRAGFLLALQRYGEAAAASDRALQINPKHAIAAPTAPHEMP